MLWPIRSYLNYSPAPPVAPRCHMAWPVSLISSRLPLALFERGRRCSRGWRRSASQMNETNTPSIIRGLAATLPAPRGSAGDRMVARSCVAGIHRDFLAKRRRVVRKPVVCSRLLPTSTYVDVVGPSCTASSKCREVRVVVVGNCCRSSVETAAADPHGTPPPPARTTPQPICQAASSTRCPSIHHPPSPSRKLFLFLCFRRNLATRAEYCLGAARCAPSTARGVSSLKRLIDLQRPTSLSKEQVPPPFRCCGFQS